ncbi:VUT family protein, partial [Lishizhenia sp.]|uniref:VUT family protein n=1 Tax=Lishizhenia sp. TaxID=2497594 RepID=UPI00299D1372
FFNNKTDGNMLCFCNIFSTLTCLLIDSISVILITYYFANGLPMKEGASIAFQLFAFVISSYLFKVVCALLDTLPFYYGTRWLKKYLQVEHEID